MSVDGPVGWCTMLWPLLIFNFLSIAQFLNVPAFRNVTLQCLTEIGKPIVYYYSYCPQPLQLIACKRLRIILSKCSLKAHRIASFVHLWPYTTVYVHCRSIMKHVKWQNFKGCTSRVCRFNFRGPPLEQNPKINTQVWVCIVKEMLQFH